MKVLHRNGEMTDVSFECPEGRAAFWHTSAHILAQAVNLPLRRNTKRLWKKKRPSKTGAGTSPREVRTASWTDACTLLYSG